MIVLRHLICVHIILVTACYCVQIANSALMRLIVALQTGDSAVELATWSGAGWGRRRSNPSNGATDAVQCTRFSEAQPGVADFCYRTVVLRVRDIEEARSVGFWRSKWSQAVGSDTQ
jgi:hypothetical protein